MWVTLQKDSNTSQTTTTITTTTTTTTTIIIIITDDVGEEVTLHTLLTLNFCEL